MTRLTCKQALQARYSVHAKNELTGIGEYAMNLSFQEAQVYYNRLVARGYDVKVRVVGVYRA